MQQNHDPTCIVASCQRYSFKNVAPAVETAASKSASPAVVPYNARWGLDESRFAVSLLVREIIANTGEYAVVNTTGKTGAAAQAAVAASTGLNAVTDARVVRLSMLREELDKALSNGTMVGIVADALDPNLLPSNINEEALKEMLNHSALKFTLKEKLWVLLAWSQSTSDNNRAMGSKLLLAQLNELLVNGGPGNPGVVATAPSAMLLNPLAFNPIMEKLGDTFRSFNDINLVQQLALFAGEEGHGAMTLSSSPTSLTLLDFIKVATDVSLASKQDLFHLDIPSTVNPVTACSPSLMTLIEDCGPHMFNTVEDARLALAMVEMTTVTPHLVAEALAALAITSSSGQFATSPTPAASSKKGGAAAVVNSDSDRCYQSWADLKAAMAIDGTAPTSTSVTLADSNTLTKNFVAVIKDVDSSLNWIEVLEAFADIPSLKLDSTTAISTIFSAFKKATGQLPPLQAFVSTVWVSVSAQAQLVLYLLNNVALTNQSSPVFTTSAVPDSIVSAASGAGGVMELSLLFRYPTVTGLCALLSSYNKDLQSTFLAACKSAPTLMFSALLRCPFPNAAGCFHYALQILVQESSMTVLVKDVVSWLLSPMPASAGPALAKFSRESFLSVLHRYIAQDLSRMSALSVSLFTLEPTMYQDLVNFCVAGGATTSETRVIAVTLIFGLLSQCMTITQALSIFANPADSMRTRVALAASIVEVCDEVITQGLMGQDTPAITMLLAALSQPSAATASDPTHAKILENYTTLMNHARTILSNPARNSNASASPATMSTPGSATTASPGSFPTAAGATTGEVSKEVEAEAVNFIAKMVKTPNTMDSINHMRKLSTSPDEKDHQVFQRIHTLLLEEARSLSDYPDAQLKQFAQFFGALVLYDLLPSQSHHQMVLRLLLQTVKSAKNQKSLDFGIIAISAFKEKLREWPNVGTLLAKIPDIDMKIPGIVAIIRSAAAAAATTASGTPSSPAPAPGASPPPQATEPGKTADLYGTNLHSTDIASSIAATREVGAGPMQLPPTTVQNRINFLISNTDPSKIDVNAIELKGLVKPEFIPYFSDYIVIKRVSLEANNHRMYLQLLMKMEAYGMQQQGGGNAGHGHGHGAHGHNNNNNNNGNNNGHGNNASSGLSTSGVTGHEPLFNGIRQATILACSKLLESDRIRTVPSERALLKSLGAWLGMITLEMNIPIMARDFDMKKIIPRGLMEGKLLGFVPFVCKVLDCCTNSRIFKPRNPWLMMLLSQLVDMYTLPELKMTLKFEVEVLFKNLNISIQEVLEYKERVYPSFNMVNFPATNNTAGGVNGVLSQPNGGPALVSMYQVPPGAGLSLTGYTGNGQRMPSLLELKWKFVDIGSTQDFRAELIIGPDGTMQSRSGIALSSEAMPYQPKPVQAVQGLPPDPAIVGGTIVQEQPKPQQHLVDRLPADLMRLLLPEIKTSFRAALINTIDPVLPEFSKTTERNVGVAWTATNAIVQKDFARDPDDQKLRAAATSMMQTLAVYYNAVNIRDSLFGKMKKVVVDAFQAWQAAIVATDPMCRFEAKNVPLSVCGGTVGIDGSVPTDGFHTRATVMEVFSRELSELCMSVLENHVIQRSHAEVNAQLEGIFMERRKLQQRGEFPLYTELDRKVESLKLPEALRPRGALHSTHLEVYGEFQNMLPNWKSAAAAAASHAHGDAAHPAAPTPASIGEKIQQAMTSVMQNALVHYQNLPMTAFSTQGIHLLDSTQMVPSVGNLSDYHGNIKRLVMDITQHMTDATSPHIVSFVFQRLVEAFDVPTPKDPTKTAVAPNELTIYSPQWQANLVVRDACILLLKHAKERGQGKVALEITDLFLAVEKKWSMKELGVALVLDKLVDLAKLDLQLSTAIAQSDPNNYTGAQLYQPIPPVEFAGTIVQRCIIDTKGGGISQKDFRTTIEQMERVAANRKKAKITHVRVPTMFPPSENREQCEAYFKEWIGICNFRKSGPPPATPAGAAAPAAGQATGGQPGAQGQPPSSEASSTGTSTPAQSDGTATPAAQAPAAPVPPAQQQTQAMLLNYVGKLHANGMLKVDGQLERFVGVALEMSVEEFATQLMLLEREMGTNPKFRAHQTSVQQQQLQPQRVLQAPSSRVMLQDPRLFTHVDALSDLIVVLIKCCLWSTSGGAFVNNTKTAGDASGDAKKAGANQTETTLISKIMQIVGRVLQFNHDFFANGGVQAPRTLPEGHAMQDSHMQQPFLRLYSNLLIALHSAAQQQQQAAAPVPPPTADGEVAPPQQDMFTIFGHALHYYCSPMRLPGFAFAWIELVCHRVFVMRLLKNQTGWAQYFKLLNHGLRFMDPFVRHREFPPSMLLFFKCMTKLFLMLLHDFPDFLVLYHQPLCDAIHPSCLQLRNIVLSAYPTAMTLSDPFKAPHPLVVSETLPDIGTPPKTVSTVRDPFKSHATPANNQPTPADAPVVEGQWFYFTKEELDGFLLSGTIDATGKRYPTLTPIQSASFLVSVVPKIKAANVLPGAPATMNTPTTPLHVNNVMQFNALILYLGIVNSEKEQPPYNIQGSPAFELVHELLKHSDHETRYLLCNAMANQLRFPNTHTNYFSTLLLYCFIHVDPSIAEVVQEIITRVIMERLMFHRPHPWGLWMTFVELATNRIYDLWEKPFVRCTPDFEKAFESFKEKFLPVNRVGVAAAAAVPVMLPGVTMLPMNFGGVGSGVAPM